MRRQAVKLQYDEVNMIVQQRKHPNRIEPVHSEESDGYDDGSVVHRPVYHTCKNCQYLQTIINNGNVTKGRGYDDGSLRRLCDRCKVLRSDGCC